ncbi:MULTISPECIES: acetyl-CoA carboxylase biotin carboxylase subunit [unclassified Sporosarcina]|uniref:acetyl-CoA carboxylase biotin carboxylase subunit n=1 Tax=unclassified Sporosarcina TaxID=2647733 RepID=UPI000C17271B|nr:MULTISPECIES: acetyl-CoA carboxylase biotin carboxylase subunit [unclassified Sporosarcina]PID03866.1 biotin carboxylase [Sporosarcina sp. P30]PID07878.1 biotin carboxylase [Sporosarcina sp. P31]PID10674.1 biotin carboxylase [Sporosarcina sp. P32b]
MFNKILIANRGEIAARVIRACKEMGIKTVAIYSEADAQSLYVKAADEAFLIGPARVNESYLNIDKIIEVAKVSGAEAIHPGYGLLSENVQFVKRCEETGLVFIGPKSEAIDKMGSKIESRKLMEKAGVPIIPGINHSLENAEEAVAVAEKIGYPMMLKASAGGGGIGIQTVKNSEELKKAFVSNQKRATDFFGNGDIFIEKFVESPRHIEIQILADSKQNTVYLWERECSIQRRHQKVLEEAPSSFLDEETRVKMGEVAVKAAKAIGYVNAGTIEFLVDEDKNFYFLEMNTRLQVEHPITEEITGIDIVKEQINIAAGKDLPFRQSDIKKLGHAIEVRIYAEDPKTFFPSPGKITKLELPSGENVRHELAINESSVITPYYDPMIAKLIVKGNTRNEAIKEMKKALDQYIIEGIKTNIPMLKEVIAHKAFSEGNTTTNFVEEHLRGKLAQL